MMSIILNILHHITLEPTTLFKKLSEAIDNGAQITQDLLIWKMCRHELNYTESECANLTEDAFEDINVDVQQHVNNFEMISQWLNTTPSLFFAFFAGSLMDNYGCKPFILVPLIGELIGKIGLLINNIFIDVLPIEFFYVTNFYSFFGGTSVFYIGVYGYGTLRSKAQNRASTLARYDGFEKIGDVVGTALSSLILISIGILGNYIICAVCMFLAFAYTLFAISNEKSSDQQSSKNLIKNFIIRPIIEMFQTLFKRRPNGLHWLILLQFGTFSIYWLSIQEWKLRYLYMLKTFSGFDGVGYSMFQIYEASLHIFGLMVVTPLLSRYFEFHDAALLTIVNVFDGLGIIFSGLATELWQFYLAHGLCILTFCKFGLVRALMSKCIQPQETGKMFSVLGILSQFVLLVANPIYRTLYNATLSTFPAAEIVLTGSLLLLSGFVNFYLYSQRSRMLDFQDNNEITMSTTNYDNDNSKVSKF